jgi:hypothetical protein
MQHSQLTVQAGDLEYCRPVYLDSEHLHFGRHLYADILLDTSLPLDALGYLMQCLEHASPLLRNCKDEAELIVWLVRKRADGFKLARPYDEHRPKYLSITVLGRPKAPLPEANPGRAPACTTSATGLRARRNQGTAPPPASTHERPFVLERHEILVEGAFSDSPESQSQALERHIIDRTKALTGITVVTGSRATQKRPAAETRPPQTRRSSQSSAPNSPVVPAPVHANASRPPELPSQGSPSPANPARQMPSTPTRPAAPALAHGDTQLDTASRTHQRVETFSALEKMVRDYDGKARLGAYSQVSICLKTFQLTSASYASDGSYRTRKNINATKLRTKAILFARTAAGHSTPIKPCCNI